MRDKSWGYLWGSRKQKVCWFRTMTVGSPLEYQEVYDFSYCGHLAKFLVLGVNFLLWRKLSLIRQKLAIPKLKVLQDWGYIAGLVIVVLGWVLLIAFLP